MYSSNNGSKWTSHQTPTNDASDARYPSQWSDWEYNEQNKGLCRYRLKGPGKHLVHSSVSRTANFPGDYEYDYSPGEASSVAGSFQPRTTQPMATISTPGQSYSSYDSYTASDLSMDTLRQGFARATIGTSFGSSSTATVAPTWQAHSSWIRTKDPTTNKESFDPRKSFKRFVSSLLTFSRLQGAQARTVQDREGKALYFPSHTLIVIVKDRKANSFQVFKVLWAEPQGNNTCGGSESTSNSVSVRPGQYGQEHYEKVRRFVIINPMSGHCICLSVPSPLNNFMDQDSSTDSVSAADPSW